MKDGSGKVLYTRPTGQTMIDQGRVQDILINEAPFIKNDLVGEYINSIFAETSTNFTLGK
jgi:hypothetical protein